MNHFCTALAIFATSINALHLDHEGAQSSGPPSPSNTEASANTDTQAAPHGHAQVNEEEFVPLGDFEALEAEIAELKSIVHFTSSFFDNTQYSLDDHEFFCPD